MREFTSAGGRVDIPGVTVKLSRREFARLIAASGLLGCGVGSPSGPGGSARLGARPGTPSGSVTPGLNRLGTGEVGDGYVYVPASYAADTPMPLVLGLHGAGGTLTGQLDLLSPAAEASGFLLVVVNSTEHTWDGLLDGFGPDVRRIDTALERAFERCNVDPARVAVEGFSDGASYALGLGLANGDLCTRIVAFSPGFLAESSSPRRGQPEVFVSHGRQDQVLPIDSTSRVLVPALQGAGYDVTYLEFDGGHSVPATVRASAVTWLLR
jgi:predicted esterase